MTHRKIRVTKAREASVLHPIVGGKPQFSKKLESVSNITNEIPSTLSTVLKIYQKQYKKKKTFLTSKPIPVALVNADRLVTLVIP